jgi:ABC-type transport system involved in multi-copper enzyme maturation permease subunit
MFKELLKRQLVEDILSFRFLLNFILIMATVIFFALIFIVHFRSLQSNYTSKTEENQQRLAQFSKNPQSGAAFANQELWMKPRGEKFLSFGSEDKIPQGFYFRMSPYELRLLNKREDITGRGWYLPVSRREFITTSAFFSPDLASIIQFLLSFFAIALVFNAITGDKEEGTLRLALSNPIKRSHFLLSKYASALLTLSLPLLLSIIIGFVLLELSGVISLSYGLILESIMFFLVSLLYISTFVLIGLLCSALCQSSRKSLVLSLLIWIFFVFIFPKSMGLFLNLKRFEVPSPQQIERFADNAAQEVGDNFAKKENLDLISDQEKRMEVLFRLEQVEDAARQSVRDSYLQKKMASVLALRKITFVCPSSLFEYASASLAGTGIVHVQYLWNQARRYGDGLISFVKREAGEKQDPSPFYLNFRAIRNKPLDSSALPRFEEKSKPFEERLKDAFPFIALLVFYNLFLFPFVLYEFQTYDVR